MLHKLPFWLLSVHDAWTNNDARTFIADGLETAEEFVRPEPKSIKDMYQLCLQVISKM